VVASARVKTSWWPALRTLVAMGPHVTGAYKPTCIALLPFRTAGLNSLRALECVKPALTSASRTAITHVLACLAARRIPSTLFPICRIDTSLQVLSSST
jgi:hypothetical protein